MLRSVISKIDKKIFNGYIRKIFYYKKNKEKRKKKINAINFILKDSENKIILLSELLKKSCENGVIVECGVGNGFSLTVLAKLSDKKIYAFDSFEGFPEKISKNDQSENDTQDLLDVLKNEKSHYKFMTVDAVKKNLINNNVSEKFINEKVYFKKGFFPDSFKGFEEKISFLHLDVDLYDSYLECLKFFFPKMMKGGVICFDEYIDKNIEPDNNNKRGKGYNWYGAKVAIDEFVLEKNLELLDHSTGFKYIIIN